MITLGRDLLQNLLSNALMKTDIEIFCPKAEIMLIDLPIKKKYHKISGILLNL